MRIRGAAELDIRQGGPQLLRNLAWFTVADGKRVPFPLDLANRRHNGCGAAGESLLEMTAGCILLPLIDGIGLLANGHTPSPRKRDQRITGNARQDRAGERRGLQGSVVKHEEDVHATQFLDPLAFDGIQKNDLVTALA